MSNVYLRPQLNINLLLWLLNCDKTAPPISWKLGTGMSHYTNINVNYSLLKIIEEIT